MSHPDTGRPLAVAHRGNPVDHRENTLPGVVDAVRARADMVEIDVKVTADGAVVLLHDLTLDRLWGHPEVVGRLSYAELLRLTPPPVAVPLLREALALLSGTPTAMLVDMDSAEWAAPSLEAVRGAVADGLVEADQVVWCGRDDSLRVIRAEDPAARIVLSWDERDNSGRPPADHLVAELRPEAYNPHWPMVSERTLDWARERGLALSCWTVDDPQEMLRLLDLGVDRITTNHIRTLREVIDTRASSLS